MAKAEIKFTQDEMDKLAAFQQTYSEIQAAFGQAKIQELRTHRQLDSLDNFVEELENKLETTQNEEQNFIEEINKKYGDGVLDPQSGVFTPNTSISEEK